MLVLHSQINFNLFKTPNTDMLNHVHPSLKHGCSKTPNKVFCGKKNPPMLSCCLSLEGRTDKPLVCKTT